MKPFKVFPAKEFDVESMKQWYKTPTEKKLEWLWEMLYFLHHVKPKSKSH